MKGNEKFDRNLGEAFRREWFDELGINTWVTYYIDYGFVFVGFDMWGNPEFSMVYNKGDNIGQATNYERAWRYSAVHHPQGYIRVADEEIRRYRVKVSFHALQERPPALIYREHWGGKVVVSVPPPLEDYEYMTHLKSGKIAVNLPPEDTMATITIVPESKDYIAEHIYSIESTEAYSKLYEATGGYFDEHTFNLTATGTDFDVPFKLIDGVEPEYIVEDRYQDEDKEGERDLLPYHWISTVANPEDGGTVNGEGLYAGGEEVTVIAEANPGYLFVNWILICCAQWEPHFIEQQRRLSKYPRRYLNENEIEQVYLVGGTSVLSAEVMREAEEIIGERRVKRLSGAGRYETARAIADEFFPSPNTAAIVFGGDFPDALAGGVHAARDDAPILLVRTNSIPVEIRQYLIEKKGSLVNIIAYGGQKAVSDAVLDEAEDNIASGQ